MRRMDVLLYLMAILLTACGDDATSTPAAANEDIKAGASAEQCGNSGQVCQADSECITTSAGQSFCALLPVPAVVALVDSSIGGRCLGNNTADLFPGVSIGSVQIMGLGFTPKGYGKLVWNQAGTAVAEQRGFAPNGQKFKGDICTEAYNLGCDGTAIFEVLGANGETLGMREGDSVIVQTRGAENCGEEFGDGIKMMLCFDPEAAKQGDLASCQKPRKMDRVNKEQFGEDHFGKTIQYVPSVSH